MKTTVTIRGTEVRKDTVKQQLSDILLDISWARLSMRYFNRSRSWLHQKLDGVSSNGGPGGFTDDERAQLRAALKDLADRIRTAADSLQ